MRKLFIAILIAAAVLSLNGCAVVPWTNWEPRGLGLVVTNIKGDPAPCVLFEHGKERSVYAASALWWAYFIPFVVVESGEFSNHLFDYPVEWWDCLAPYEMAWGPRERDVFRMEQLAEWISPHWLGNLKQKETPRRWILSNEPMVIAIGTDQISPDWNAPVYSLVRRSEMDRTATELLIIDKWPQDWSHVSPTGTEFDKMMVESLAKVTRHVRFDHPITLREIFEHRLWEPGATPELATSQR